MGTMKAADLYRIVNEAQQFASSDPTLPAIGVVRVEITGMQIVAVATDRFTLGMSKADYEQSSEDWAFALHPAERKQLLTVAKTAKKDEDYRHVTIQRAEDGYVVFKFITGEEVRLREASEEFPKYRELFPTVDEVALSEPVNIQAVDAQLFAKFAKVSDGGNGKSTRVKWVAHRIVKDKNTPDHREIQKPSIVTIGENFVGLIMPVRLPDEDNGRYKLEYPAWF